MVLICKAQMPVYDIATITERKDGAYYKDVNNLFDPFCGVYRYTDGKITLQIALRKVVKSYFYKESPQDYVGGEILFVKDGVEYVNTLPDFDANGTLYDDSYEYVNAIKAFFTYKGKRPWCQDCAPNERTLFGSFVDTKSKRSAHLYFRKITINGVDALKVSIVDGGNFTSIWGEDYPRPRMAIEYGDFILSKAYMNKQITKSYTKTNCSIGSTPETITYVVDANKYTSVISQADADQLAMNDANQNGAAYANSIGKCTYTNVAQSGSFFKNDCPVDCFVPSVVFNVQQGKYTSTISQADADKKAQDEVNANGQKFANYTGKCFFRNKAMNYGFTKNNCPTGSVGSIVYFAVVAGAYTSSISQADADAKARAAGQIYANTKGTCTRQPKPDIR